jgi:predicted nuclease of predicted toxin-antitoxin system
LRLRDVGLDKSLDSEVLAYAASEHWIVVSHDVNTMSAAANTRLIAGQPMHGLLLVHQLSPLAAVIENLVLIWSASEAEEWVNQVCFLPL